MQIDTEGLIPTVLVTVDQGGSSNKEFIDENDHYASVYEISTASSIDNRCSRTGTQKSTNIVI